MSSETFPPLWRLLALSVPGGFFALGSFVMVSPTKGAAILGIRPPPGKSSLPNYLSESMVALGARDISIAAALFTFYYRNQPKEMGILTLAASILCAADIWIVWKTGKRDYLSAFLVLGAAAWVGIGVGLVRTVWAG